MKNQTGMEEDKNRCSTYKAASVKTINTKEISPDFPFKREIGTTIALKNCLTKFKGGDREKRKN